VTYCWAVEKKIEGLLSILPLPDGELFIQVGIGLKVLHLACSMNENIPKHRLGK